jgi:dephospho-CoA kinase
MIKVAVTGGIGSGKTLVCSVFEILGIPVFYADQSAKELMNSNPYVKEKIISNFGKNIFDKNGQLIRDKLAEIIFNNKILLLKINEIVHPVVREEFNKWMQGQESVYVIEESAIVFETGQNTFFDKIISVVAPLELRIDRIMKRDNISREKVLERLKNQYTDENKMKNSDFIITNDKKEMIVPQIIKIHEKLTREWQSLGNG